MCEVIADPQRFDGKDLASWATFDATDEGRWLSEDNGGRRLATENFTWPNAIWLDCCQRVGPSPPGGSMPLDEAALAEKLSHSGDG